MKVKRSLLGFHNASGTWITLVTKVSEESLEVTLTEMADDAQAAVELLSKGDSVSFNRCGEADGLSKWAAETQFIRLKDFSIIKSVTEIIQYV